MVLPATMELLGGANWWLPRWLKRLPEIRLEGAEPVPVLAVEEEDLEVLVGTR
jgi:RND superfamily putative drug exporter